MLINLTDLKNRKAGQTPKYVFTSNWATQLRGKSKKKSNYSIILVFEIKKDIYFAMSIQHMNLEYHPKIKLLKRH